MPRSRERHIYSSHPTVAALETLASFPWMPRFLGATALLLAKTKSHSLERGEHAHEWGKQLLGKVVTTSHSKIAEEPGFVERRDMNQLLSPQLSLDDDRQLTEQAHEMGVPYISEHGEDRLWANVVQIVSTEYDRLRGKTKP